MSSFNDADLDRFLAEDPGGPVVMLNLLRFRPDGGRERYDDYARAAQEIAGPDDNAEPVYFGAGGRSLEDDRGRDWDAVVLVRYPSRRAFVDLVRAPAYREIAYIRDEALEDAVLQPTTSLLG